MTTPHSNTPTKPDETPGANAQGQTEAKIKADEKSARRVFNGPIWGLAAAAILAVVLLAGLGAFLFFLSWAHKDSEWPELVLAVVVLVAVVILTLSFGGLGIVLNRLKLTNPKEALGLPTGSIRAVLAVLLILLFMVLSIFLLGRLQGRGAPTRHLTHVSEAQLAAIPLDQIISRTLETPEATETTGGQGSEGTSSPTPVPQAGEATSEPDEDATTGEPAEAATQDTEGGEFYDVRLSTPISPTLENFSLQLLTTMSTLVVAIAAFYFGSRSVEQATAAVTGRKAAEESEDTVIAIADIPGRFSPPGAVVPDNLDALKKSRVIPDPSSPWEAGRFVRLGDNTSVHWDGGDWKEGTS